MEIFLLLIAIGAGLFCIFSIIDDEPDAFFLFFLVAIAFLLFYLAASTDPVLYDVSCGENTYQSVELEFEGDYLKIMPEEGAEAFEDGPCEWDLVTQ